MSDRQDAATHRFHIRVDFVRRIDPDRVDEWIDANFDRENENIKITDLTRGDGVTAPVVADVGPGIGKMVFDDD